MAKNVECICLYLIHASLIHIDKMSLQFSENNVNKCYSIFLWGE